MKLISFVLVMVLNGFAFGQLKGVIYGHQAASKEALYGAKIKSLRTNTGVISGEDGAFEIILGKELPDTLVFSYNSYLNDTLIVDKKDRFALIEVNLYSNQLLPEVVAAARTSGHSISKLKTLHVETIGENELRKAACCNLSESFETNASVDVNMTDAVSGAKKIQMMGLDGVYTQIQMENIPYMRGLESAFGLGTMPGTWIESIQITKGTGNVVNGYESMAGLINLELKKPETIEKLFVNAYGNNFGRAELNVHGGGSVSKKWKSAYFVHGSSLQTEVDQNNDGFRDLPKSNNISVLNRWEYQGKRFETKLGVNAFLEDKLGGQTGFRGNSTPNLYGVTIQNRHVDVFAKTGFLFAKKPYRSIGIVYNLKYQETNAQFGNRLFTGSEKRGYINAIWDDIIGNTNHGIKYGVSFVYTDLSQKLDSIHLPRVEYVPGVFTEYTYKGSRFTGVAGLRADLHNLYGLQVSPRIHGKFSLTEYLDLRFTAGRGFRVPNVMIDNISLLATSRDWAIESNIQPEVSWNMGGSLVYEFKLFKRKADLSLDYYHTLFENQVLIDRDQDFNTIYFRNLIGKSYSNSFQAELSFELMPRLDARLAYKFLDVKANYGGIFQQQVMIPRHRGFVNLAYQTHNKRWEYTTTLSVFGRSRLHHVAFSEGVVSKVNESAIYPILNAQITHVYKRFDFYIGGENLTNYKQKDAIVNSENPFGSFFDATRVWAPIQGITVYAGIRFSIKQKEKHTN